MSRGRFAPSPTGPLHLGNLRTALVAWLWARRTNGTFVLRFEDLDTASVRPEHYASQADDLRRLGLDWDGDPIRQSDRIDRYRDAIAHLRSEGRLYPCFCSRREIREAVHAPNGPSNTNHYPGTCRSLSESERAEREADGRPPAWRFRGEGLLGHFHDEIVGDVTLPIDDFVVERGDGTPAYNLAVLVDDADGMIELVVRADDLVDSTPRQLALADALDLPSPRYGHIPLVLNEHGDRLAKRDGAVTLDDRIALGETEADVLGFLAVSLDLSEPGEPVTADVLVSRFDPAQMPRQPLILGPDELSGRAG